MVQVWIQLYMANQVHHLLPEGGTQETNKWLCGSMKNSSLWLRPMALNTHPASANVALYRARETKPKWRPTCSLA